MPIIINGKTLLEKSELTEPAYKYIAFMVFSSRKEYDEALAKNEWQTRGRLAFLTPKEINEAEGYMVGDFFGKDDKYPYVLLADSTPTDPAGIYYFDEYSDDCFNANEHALFRSMKTLPETINDKYIVEQSTKDVIYADRMFANCIELETLPDFDFSKCQTMSGVIYNCTSLRYIGTWKVSNSTIVYDKGFYRSFLAGNTPTNEALTHFDGLQGTGLGMNLLWVFTAMPNLDDESICSVLEKAADTRSDYDDTFINFRLIPVNSPYYNRIKQRIRAMMNGGWLFDTTVTDHFGLSYT